MSASGCAIEELSELNVELESVQLFARGVRMAGQPRCPACGSVIYTRRHKLCGVCAEPLPSACLFSAEEASRVRSIVEEERQRHRNWLHRANFGN